MKESLNSILKGEISVGSKRWERILFRSVMRKSVADLKTSFWPAEMSPTHHWDPSRLLAALTVEWNPNSVQSLKALSPPYLSSLISCHWTFKICFQTMFPPSITSFEKADKKKKRFSFHKFPQELNYYFFQLWNNHAASRKGAPLRL